MRGLKAQIVNVASREVLRQVADEFGLEVADRRKHADLAKAVSAAKRCTPSSLLRLMPERDIKQVCEALGVDPKGRKAILIGRLVDNPPVVSNHEPASKKLETRQVQSKPGAKLAMSDKLPLQSALPLPEAVSQPTSVEKYEFEPIKGYPMLNWRGKRPFTSTQYYPAQLKEVHGDEIDGWRNKIFWGDNLQVMSHLLKEFRGKVDLIYIDPPFDSKIEYKRKIHLQGVTSATGYSAFEEKQYSDVWVNDEYLQFMFERLILMRDLLSKTGVICLHCDWHKSHYLRAILDEIFGQPSFRNEIVWYYYNKMQGNIGRFASNHDIILVYSKSESFQFNKLREKRDVPVKQIKRVWDKHSQSLVNAKDENGNVIYINATHKTVDDVWRIPMLQPADKVEVVGYPTQKPESLLERVILGFSKPSSIVFDCFMGSGTTQMVAAKYGRKYIGNDINLASIQIATKRLLSVATEIEAADYKPSIKNGLNVNSQADLLDEEEDDIDWMKTFDVAKVYPGFEIYNVNNYDIFRNPIQAKELLSEALEVQALDMAGIYDGEKDGRMVKIMPVNRIATRADLNELISGFDQKVWQRRQNDNPTRPVEKILLVCMGHEPDLKAQLELSAKPFKIDVEVIDILRDKANLEFKRDAQAKISLRKKELVVERFYPMNLLQKLSMEKENVADWRELVESILIDWNYDGAVLQPAVVDIPEKNDLVAGRYAVPDDAGTVRVKITDLLSESWEGTLTNG